MTKALIIITIILSSFLNLYSQPWLKSEKKDKSQISFFERKKQFYKYWETHKSINEHGYKQFKRSEYFLEPRVNSQGFLPSQILWQESQKLRKQIQTKASSSQWQELGPFDTPLEINSGRRRGSGRINAIAFHPTDPNTIFVGAPAGGCWKTTNGGQTWTCLTDDLPSLGISAIAIDPVNPNVIYLGTGDGDASDTYSIGVLKSTDGGQTWNATSYVDQLHVQASIKRIIVNKLNHNEVLVLGGGIVKKSYDAGLTWSSKKIGSFRDMLTKPGDPNIVYLAGYNYNGGANIYRSTNFGDNFQIISPNNIIFGQAQRIALAVTPYKPNIIYALCSQNNNGFHSIWKSYDMGDTWEKIIDYSQINLLGWSTNGNDSGGQAWYDLAFAVSPTDENILFVGGVNVWRSLDGGYTWELNGHWYGGGGATYIHADQHIFRYNPLNNILYAGNDGGIYKTENEGNSWEDISDGISILQLYRLSTSFTNPDIVTCGAQDNGTMKKNSTQWNAILGGDGMETLIDYTDENVIYGESQYGNMNRSTDGGYNFTSIKPSGTSNGNWVTPYIIDYNNHNTLYAGFKDVYKSTNRGNSWTKISTNIFGGANIVSLAIAKSNSNYIYAASNSSIKRTKDGGATWTSINGAGNQSYITYIAVDPVNPEKIWFTTSGFYDNQKIYTSNDAGDTWQNISGGLPNVPANCVTASGTNYGAYIGTDLGVFYRDTTLSQWVPFNYGLPNVVIDELEINTAKNEIFAATYGRGIWSSPLYQQVLAPVSDFSFSIISGCSGQVDFVNESTSFIDSIIWDFGDGTTENALNPTHYYLSSGTYQVTQITYNNIGSDTSIQTVNINAFVQSPVVADTSVCENSQLNLTATSTNTVNWFDENNNLISSTNNFITGNLNNDTLFYVCSIVDYDINFARNDTNNTNINYNSANSEGLIFNAYNSFILKSTKVYANSSGNRTFYLTDSLNNIIDSVVVNLATGENIVNLNFNIPVQNNLKLVANANSSLLYEDSTASYFPYNVAPYVEILKSTAGYNSYYYFYDWQITIANCKSETKEINITVIQKTVADFTYSVFYNYVNFFNNSQNSTSYIWNFNDGTTDTLISLSHQFTDINQTYDVSLIAKNSCFSDTITKTINPASDINDIKSGDNQVIVYPNPTKEQANIMININKQSDVNLYIYDINGKEILNKKYKTEKNINSAIHFNNKGIYLLKTIINKKIYYNKIIVF